MKSSKKLTAALLALLICFGVLTACGTAADKSGEIAPATTGSQQSPAQSPTQAPAPTAAMPSSEVFVPEAPVEGANLADHIDVIVDSQLTIVNPFMIAGTGSEAQRASFMVHDRLVEQPETGVIGPQLAYDWETDDYQTFIFYLRDDVYFHNGDHFTAEDVLWNIEIANSFPGSPAYTKWTAVSSARALDTYVVELQLREPNIDFFFDLAEYTNSICNRRAYEENPDDPTWGFIGTGPFKVVDFASNDYLTIERCDDYWGDLPPTRSVTFWTIPEQATRTVMLQTGQVQVAFSLTPQDLNIIEASPDFNIFSVLVNEPVWLGFNNQGDEIMMDPNFRLAVAHALNTADVEEVAYGRWGQAPWDGNFWGPSSQYRLEGLPKREYDPALAKEYLERSSYNGEPVEILTAIASNIRAAEIVQLQLMDIGIDANVEIMEMAGFFEAISYNPDSKVQMHIFSGAMNPIANVALRLGYYPGQNTNRLNYNNEYLNGLIDQYGSTANTVEREAIAHDIQRFLYDDIPAVALFWRIAAVPTVNGIGGIKLSSDPFNHDLRGIYWNLDEAPANLRP